MAITAMEARKDHYKDSVSRPVMANNASRRVGERHSVMSIGSGSSSEGDTSGRHRSLHKSQRIARIRVLLAPEMNPYVIPLHKVQTWEVSINAMYVCNYY